MSDKVEEFEKEPAVWLVTQVDGYPNGSISIHLNDTTTAHQFRGLCSRVDHPEKTGCRGCVLAAHTADQIRYNILEFDTTLETPLPAASIAAPTGAVARTNEGFVFCTGEGCQVGEVVGHVTSGSDVLAAVAAATRSGRCAMVLDCGEGCPNDVPFKRQTGWSAPLDVLQMTSWALVGFEVFVFYGVIQFMWEDAVRWALLGLYSIILLVLLTAAGYSTCCDPIDPLAPLPPATAAEQFPEADLAYCSKCEREVVATSRHCLLCCKCVHKFDHHCRWLNNCIGEANYKSFLVCVGSLFALNVLHACLLLAGWIHFRSCGELEDALEGSAVASCAGYHAVGALNLLVCAAAGLLSGQLVWLHWYLAGKGLTTFDYFNGLEQKEKQKVAQVEQDAEDQSEEDPEQHNDQYGEDTYGEDPLPESVRSSEGEGGKDDGGVLASGGASGIPVSPSSPKELPPLKGLPRKGEDKYALPGLSP